MQSLLVQALTLRQLGRLKARQLLTPGYGLGGRTEWCPRTIHTRQLWGSSALLTLGSHRPAVCGRDTAVGSWCFRQLRFKSKRRGVAKATQEEEEEEDDDEDKRDPEDSDYEDEVEDDPNLPKDYKDLEKHVQSCRYDVIMKCGLDIARNKIEDAFYKDKLRLNGERLMKKSKPVKVGDTLDLVLLENRETDTVTLKRVVIRKVLSKDEARQKVVLRRWKHLELPNGTGTPSSQKVES